MRHRLNRGLSRGWLCSPPFMGVVLGGGERHLLPRPKVVR